MKNWKTTTAGIVVILIAVLHGVILPVLNGTAMQLGEVSAATITGIGLIHASDSKPAQ